MKKSAIFLALCVLPAGTAFAQSTQGQVTAADVQASKAKLSPALQQAIAPGAKSYPETPYEAWLSEPSVEKSHAMGIPRAVKSGKGKSPMEGAYPFKLENFSFIIAEYQGNISELYIKKKGGRYKNLFHFDPCNKIYLIKPGEKAPTFLVIRASNCDTPANWQETLYQMSPKGRLEEVGHLGGLKANVRMVDVDQNGVLEIINSTAKGPSLMDNIVYKWNGTEWAKAAEYYNQLEK